MVIFVQIKRRSKFAAKTTCIGKIMSKTRRLSLILGSVVALIIITALQAYKYTPVTGQGRQPISESLDSGRLGAQVLVPLTGRLAGNQPNPGIGDLRRFEAFQETK
jgi:hypothetical protein